MGDLMPKAFFTNLPMSGAEITEKVHSIFIRTFRVIWQQAYMQWV